MLENNLFGTEGSTDLFRQSLDSFQPSLSDRSPFEPIPSTGIGESLPPVSPLLSDSSALPSTVFETAAEFGMTDSDALGSDGLSEKRLGNANVDPLTGLARNSTDSDQGVASRLGGEFGAWNPVEKVTNALARIVDTGSQQVRLALRLDQFWRSNRPTPEYIDQHLLAAHDYGLQPFLLIDYYDATVGKIEDFDWFSIGQAFATRFQPNSPWLTAQGINNWGVEIYSIFNEPDLRSLWDTQDNGIGFDYQLYHDSMEAFADGVHAVNTRLKVIPGGFASHRESGDWTARGYGNAIGDLLNDGTLDGLHLHNYDSLGKKAWTAQEQFRRHKEAMGVTRDVNYYIDEFNNSRENKTGSAFLTSIWDQLGVVGNAGNGAEGKTKFALPFTLNAIESEKNFGLAVDANASVPSERVAVWKRLNELTQGMSFTQYSPNFFGTYELAGNGKKMWVWQNRKAYTGFPGKSVVLHGVPTDATKVDIHTYQGLYNTVTLQPGQTSISLDQLPENQTLMFVANGSQVTTPGGVFAPLKLDFNPSLDHVSPSGFQRSKRQAYTPWAGHGWTQTNGIQLVERPVSDPLYKGLLKSAQSGEFNLSVPQGNYRVTLHLGDPSYERDQMKVTAEDTVIWESVNTAAGEIQARSFDVAVTDGLLNLQLQDQGGNNSIWSMAAFEITPLIAAPPTESEDTFEPFKVDFNPSLDHIPTSGFIRSGRQTYTSSRGYGWAKTDALQPVNRPAENSLYQGLIKSTKKGEFKLAVPNGEYQVTLHLGDPKFKRDRVRVKAEDALVWRNISTAAGEVSVNSFNVAVTDGILNIVIKDRGGDNPIWSLAALEVSPLTLLT